MEKLNFSIDINAPKQKVWNVLFDDGTYQEWTSVFAPGSHVETDWKKGSKAVFLDGEGNGMVSRIAESEPPDFLAIEHRGEIHNGKEDSEKKDWTGAIESYKLTETGGKTTLRVEMDSNEKWKEFFSGVWPKALDKVKEIAER
jgi:hypothetical protein